MFLANDYEGYLALIGMRAIQLLAVVGISIFTCQILKGIILSIRNKDCKFWYFTTTGGFPSSHSAAVISLIVCMGILQLTDSGALDYSFAVACTFGFIVLHDAVGVRLEASKHAVILNKLVEDEPLDTKEKLGYGKKGKLKELLGHKKFEVFGGVLFGIISGLIGAAIILA